MNNKKFTKNYYISVEGQTEQWYFERLKDIINNCSCETKVSLKTFVGKPEEYVKTVSILYPTKFHHVCDFETENNDTTLKQHIDSMRNAEKTRNIKYTLSYSNLTFELWIILHKKDLNSHLSAKNQYLSHINSCYGESFQSLSAYKKENAFKRILSRITLEDIKKAIERAKSIIQQNERNGYSKQTYRKEKYYKENPALSIHKIIEKILEDCGCL